MKFTTFINKYDQDFVVTIRDEHLQENIITMTLSPEDFSNFVYGRSCPNVNVDIKTNIIGKVKRVKRFCILYPSHSHIKKGEDLINFIKQQDKDNFKDGWEFEDLIAYGLDKDDLYNFSNNWKLEKLDAITSIFGDGDGFTKCAVYTIRRYEDEKQC
jgi:hypothetical protein